MRPRFQEAFIFQEIGILVSSSLLLDSVRRLQRLTIDSFPETQTANSGTCQPLLRNAVIISNSNQRFGYAERL